MSARCPQCSATEWNEASRLRAALTKIHALLGPESDDTDWRDGNLRANIRAIVVAETETEVN